MRGPSSSAQRFRLIFLTGNAFQAFLTNADQRALLGLRARASARRRPLRLRDAQPALGRRETVQDRAGLFVNLETRTEERAFPGYTDALGRRVRVTRTQAYDHVAQVLHWTTFRRWREGDRECARTTRIALRYTFPQELAALLEASGFSIARQYGDWDLSPLTAASPSILVVCQQSAHLRWRSRGGVHEKSARTGSGRGVGTRDSEMKQGGSAPAASTANMGSRRRDS